MVAAQVGCLDFGGPPRSSAEELSYCPHQTFYWAVQIGGLAERLRHDPDWTVTDLHSGHNFLAHGSDELLTVILELA